MKIRNKITLWFTGAGLLAALVFSMVIFYELVEQPFELIDKELDNHAYTLLIGLSPQNGIPISTSNATMLQSLGSLYWFKVFDQQQKLLYASSMSKSVDIPLQKKNKRYNVYVTDFPQANSGKVPFRVRIATIPFGGQEYLIQIARPMKKLWEEIIELVLIIGLGLLFFTLALILQGYFVASKILQPLIEINTLTEDINDKTLDTRIPLGKNQDELHALSSSLNQMFDRLQFSFKRQKSFIGNASHELKTPISMLQLFFGEAIQRNDLPEDFREKLITQSETTLRMSQLVKNLLDLSALERNETLDLETVDLTQLVTSILKEFDELIQAADICLSLDMEKTVHLQADKQKLWRMLINLIDNGIKYNLKQNGEIRFSLSETDENVQIEISNTGPTIPEDELKLVFKQFYRVEKSRATALGGSGLGLTIVERIVERHHGTIEIENTHEGFVLIRILLPR
jgi:two-component system, OmpR family, sensor kinase